MTELTTTLLPTRGSASTEPTADLLVVLPSLGTGVKQLWQYAVAGLPANLRVVGVDLPGHGLSAPSATQPGEATTIAELAEQVLSAVRTAVPDTTTFAVAGDSIGGEIALQLALDHADLVTQTAVFCSGAQIGDPAAWEERAQLVETAGTPTQIIGSAQRWFGEGFIAGHSVETTELLHNLQDADRFSYAALCRALAAFDVRDRLGELAMPVLAVAGDQDQPTPPANLEFIAANATDGSFALVEGAAHLVPVEAPARVAELLRAFLTGEAVAGSADTGATTHTGLADLSRTQVHEAGMAVRREVLGAAHVERSIANTSDFTRDFQDYITRTAWGEIWTRPGLDRRMRSAVTLTAMVSGGHHEELAMHVSAALRNGLSRDEIKEILLQSAVYCSVPAANTAFKIAAEVLENED